MRQMELRAEALLTGWVCAYVCAYVCVCVCVRGGGGLLV